MICSSGLLDQTRSIHTDKVVADPSNPRLGLLIINTVAVSLVLSVQNKEQHNYEITGKLQPQIEIISTFKVLWNTFPSF